MVTIGSIGTGDEKKVAEERAKPKEYYLFNSDKDGVYLYTDEQNAKSGYELGGYERVTVQVPSGTKLWAQAISGTNDVKRWTGPALGTDPDTVRYSHDMSDAVHIKQSNQAGLWDPGDIEEWGGALQTGFDWADLVAGETITDKELMTDVRAWGGTLQTGFDLGDLVAGVGGSDQWRMELQGAFGGTPYLHYTGNYDGGGAGEQVAGFSLADINGTQVSGFNLGNAVQGVSNDNLELRVDVSAVGSGNPIAGSRVPVARSVSYDEANTQAINSGATHTVNLTTGGESDLRTDELSWQVDATASSFDVEIVEKLPDGTEVSRFAVANAVAGPASGSEFPNSPYVDFDITNNDGTEEDFVWTLWARPK